MTKYATIYCGPSTTAAKVDGPSAGSEVEVSLAGAAAKANELSKCQPIIIQFNKELPQVYEAAGEGVYPKFIDHGWNKLVEAGAHDIGILLTVDLLQNCDAGITEGLSLEQTVEDFASELYLLPRLKALSRFRHLFVIDKKAIIYVRNAAQDPTRSLLLEGVLIFVAPPRVEKSTSGDDCKAKKQKQENYKESCAAYAKLNLTEEKTSECCFTVLSFNTSLTSYEGIRKLRQKVNRKLKRVIDDNGTTVVVPIPHFVFQEPLPDRPRSTRRWRILDQTLQDAPIHRINIAVAVVKAGIPQVLNREWGRNARDDEVGKILTRVEYWNPRDRAPDFVTMDGRDRPAMPPQARARLPVIRGRDDHDAGFCLAVPIAEFGIHAVAEREQVETLRGIERLIGAYCKDVVASGDGKKPRHEVPLSIAVFAPPGAGKSFTVKQVAATVGYEEGDFLEFNVAQFRKAGDLDEAFDRIYGEYDKYQHNYKKYQKDCGEGKSGDPPNPPFVFFDEFDCARDMDDLGWLKYFLAPMQDGSLPPREAGNRATNGQRLGEAGEGATNGQPPREAGEGATNGQPPREVSEGATNGRDPIGRIKRAIFVFAGGVYKSFDEFDPREEFPTEDLAYTVSEEYKKEVKRFADRKGPDFISRLRGYIDIPEANAEPGNAKHFLRRAIQLRGLLEKLHFAKKNEIADVDEPLIYALLTVDKYRHGVRSMEAVLRMCKPHTEKEKNPHLHITSLPERPQLNMHVDAEKFYVRLHRGRARMQPRLSGEIASDVGEIKERFGRIDLKQLKTKFEALADELATRSFNDDATELEAELRVLKKLLDFETKKSADAGS